MRLASSSEKLVLLKAVLVKSFVDLGIYMRLGIRFRKHLTYHRHHINLKWVCQVVQEVV